MNPGTAWARRDVGRWHGRAPAHKPHLLTFCSALTSSSPGIWREGKGAGSLWLAELILLPVGSPPAWEGAPCQLSAHLTPLLPAPGVTPGRWLLELLPQPWRSTRTRQRSRGTRARSPGRESRGGNSGGSCGRWAQIAGAAPGPGSPQPWAAPPAPTDDSGTPCSASCPSPGCTLTSSKMEPVNEGSRHDPRH